MQLRVAGIGLLAVAIAVTTLFAALGLWQLDRAEQKRATFAEFERRGQASQVDINLREVGDGTALSGYRAFATGHYIGASILLDNQVHHGRAGYLVYSVFELDGRKKSVLVNRGWMNAEADRSRAPKLTTPTVSQQLEGRLSLPPQGGLRLEVSDMIERLEANLWRVQAIDFVGLTATVGVELLPSTFLLHTDALYGFVRAWTPPASDENRHLGYAFQWFALALTVVVVTVVVTLHSDKANTP